MREAMKPKEFGGEAIYVCHCYVWTEIYYLDSPTCYRECISNHVSQSARIDSELITLDNPWRFSSRAAAKFLVTLPARLLTWRASLTGKIPTA
jgi:hypothetical protein